MSAVVPQLCLWGADMSEGKITNTSRRRRALQSQTNSGTLCFQPSSWVRISSLCVWLNLEWTEWQTDLITNFYRCFRLRSQHQAALRAVLTLDIHHFSTLLGVSVLPADHASPVWSPGGHGLWRAPPGSLPVSQRHKENCGERGVSGEHHGMLSHQRAVLPPGGVLILSFCPCRCRTDCWCCTLPWSCPPRHEWRLSKNAARIQRWICLFTLELPNFTFHNWTQLKHWGISYIWFIFDSYFILSQLWF